MQPVTVSSDGSNKLWSFTGGQEVGGARDRDPSPVTIKKRRSLGHESNEQVT